MEVLAFISFLLGASWDFFTETKVPGFDFSFAALFVGLFMANLGLRFLTAMLGVSFGSGTITGVLRHNEAEGEPVNTFQFTRIGGKKK